jgi:hypothetical protein
MHNKKTNANLMSIAMLHHTINDGASMRVVCPVCDGGSSRELSMSVTKAGNKLLYKCHRASCNDSGSLVIHDEGEHIKVVNPHKNNNIKTQAKIFSGKLIPLSDGWYKYLWDNYNILGTSADSCGLKHTTDGRLAMPIRSFHGIQTGLTLRNSRFKDNRFPKSKTYITNNVLWTGMAWYVTTEPVSDELFLVEDQLSAIRLASEGRMAAALLGTSINYNKLVDIQRFMATFSKVGRIHLALDPDATPRAVQLWNEYRGVLPLQVKYIAKDFKNMSTEEFRQNTKTL